MEVVVKLANTDAEKKAVLSIRREVFMVEQDVPPEEEIDEFEQSSTHIIAYANKIPVGTARWRVTESGIKLERFSVLKPYRGHQIGRKLVEFVLANVESDTIYLHAQEQVIAFYEKFGFMAIGNRFYEADIPHKKMTYSPPE